jgi:hypothetical protein
MHVSPRSGGGGSELDRAVISRVRDRDECADVGLGLKNETAPGGVVGGQAERGVKFYERRRQHASASRTIENGAQEAKHWVCDDDHDLVSLYIGSGNRQLEVKLRRFVRVLRPHP